MHPVVEEVTDTIRERSRGSRRAYLERCRYTGDNNPPRERLSCGNLAHSYAGCGESDKQTLKLEGSPNLGIVTAYNDMLSAHQPLQFYPDEIKAVAREFGATAQVAGGVPAMCDGVTQGQPGMELSLFSRDLIAMATAVSLSHNTFDGVLCLGVCDKIVPGLLMGALQFGHLPVGFIPAGPMPTGISNREKAAVRQRYAEGKASRDELLEVESASYHSPGTCTFYGTANSNQMLMELLGVQLPGASFINPEDPLRPLLTRETVIRVMEATARGRSPLPLCEVVTEASVVNALVGLLATGGSTNHCLHLVAMARCAGIDLRWEDFHRLSAAVPLLVRIYPNGDEDVNAFQSAGGMAFLVRELRGAGLLNEDVVSFPGQGLATAECAPEPGEAQAIKRECRVTESLLPEVLRPASDPFDREGGLRHLTGNLGEAVIKVSAVKPEHRKVEAPCRVFTDQDQVRRAFEAGELAGDLVVVMRGQGPSANGMPELHKLTPYLGVLQDRGQQVALVTDGRMSGASGKVPAAIHLCPEAIAGGPIARLRDGDRIRVDTRTGELAALVEEGEWSTREPAPVEPSGQDLGRGLFAPFRGAAGPATAGASVFFGNDN